MDGARATLRNLTTIYITRGHADHFFGLATIPGAFAGASAVTALAVVSEASGQLSPDLMRLWNAIFPGVALPDEDMVALDETIGADRTLERRWWRETSQKWTAPPSALCPAGRRTEPR